MSTGLYRFGLLILVFGGFLASNSTGRFSGVALSVMIAGVVIGSLGLLQKSLPDR